MTEPQPPAIPVEQRVPAALHAYRLAVWTAVIVATIVLLQQPRTALPEAPATNRVAVLENLSSDFTEAETRKDMNERSADSAPKQQVVNGWYTNDLLEIVGDQVDSLLRIEAQLLESQEAAASNAYELSVARAQDHRTESLIAVLGLGAAAHVAGSSLILLLAGRPRRAGEDGPDATVEPEATVDLSEAQPFDPRPL